MMSPTDSITATIASTQTFGPRLASCLMANWLLLVVALTFAAHDLGELLCVGIAVGSGVGLFIFGVTKTGKQRLVVLLLMLTQLVAEWSMLSNYMSVRDHVRWLFLSGSYKARLIAQPHGPDLPHVEWDAWGFAGVGDTTEFLVFDPNDSLRAAAGVRPPVRAQGVPCEVVSVRRLSPQWYAILFYTDIYWGKDADGRACED